MSKKQASAKSLVSIMQKHKTFNHAVDLFVDTLIKKRDWKRIESDMKLYQLAGWSATKMKQIYLWERRAYVLYNQSQDKSLGFIKNLAAQLSDEEFDELGTWIRFHPHSKEAWQKNGVTVEESAGVIKARIVHLLYMSRSPKPVNIGELIENKE